jgi:hypothetical protein
MRGVITAFLLSALVLVPALAPAATIQVLADAGVGLSSNINRTVEDEKTGVLESVGLRFAAEREGPRLSTDMVGDLAWINFSGGNYASRLTGTATGRATLDVVQDHLQWKVEDNFGQTRRDLFAVPSPDNSENVNFFSTGPDARISLGRLLDVVLGGRFTLVEYEASPADTRRYGGWFGIEHELPVGARIGASVTHETVEPRQQASFPSYQRSAAFASLAVTGLRTSMNFDAGVNRVDVGGDLTTGVMGRMQIDREFGEYLHFTLRVGRELTDSGESLSLGPGLLLVQGQQGGSLIQEAQPFINQYLSAAWYIGGARTTIQLYGGWYDEDYQYTNLLDRQRQQLGLSMSRDFRVRMQFLAGADFSRDQYASALLVDNLNLTARVGGAWMPFEKAGVEVTLERNLYHAQDVPNVVENRLWIHLRYGIPPERSPRLR